MVLLSTRDKTITATAAQAFIQGIAPSGGLFVPAEYPSFSIEDIAALAPLSYQQRALAVMAPFISDFSREELSNCIEKAYGNSFDSATPAPLRKVGNAHVLELWHGPTSAFKDMALQILPHLLTLACEKQNKKEETMILVATSGDTGKAALEGFADVQGTRVFVFYPKGGVSRAQYLQMATQKGNNVHVAAVEGNFDDAQTGVKKLFADPAFIQAQKDRGRTLSSANSINFGRLLPQVVYYFSAYADLLAQGTVKAGDKVNFVVPTGNFGNILAAWYAKQMGLPIHKLICASNRNNVLADFISTGNYDARRSFYKTTSPSMDILISSNLERLLFDLCGRDDQPVSQWMNALQTQGHYQVAPEHAKVMQEAFYGGWADDQAAAAAIGRLWRKERYLMDPHTAVAWEIYERYEAGNPDDHCPAVVVSTASPYKFSGEVLKAIDDGKTFDDEFQCTARLQELSGLPMPKALSELPSLPILHDAVCSIDAMGDTVLAITP